MPNPSNPVVVEEANTATTGLHAAPAMPGAPTTPLASAREVRWGAAALVLGSLLFVRGVIFGLQAFEGDWDTTLGPTLPETAALIQEKWPSFQSIWFGELLGALLLGIAGFLLQRRVQAVPRWMPASVAWIAVGVGSILVAVSYALTLGSYPPALDAFGEQPTLFAALRGGVLRTHLIGSLLQGLGLTGALLLDFRWKGRALPDRLVQGGIALVLLGILAASVGLIPGAYTAAAAFLAAALLGVAIWRRADEPA